MLMLLIQKRVVIAVEPNQLVTEYLRRLEHAAVGLPPQRRTELLTEIRTHIADALRATGRDDDVAIFNVLERLGPPEEIAAAAIRENAPTQPSAPAAVAVPHRGFARVALVVLAVGFVLPFVGWVIGAVLVATSDAWSTREKVTGLLVGVLVMLAVAPVLTVAVGRDSSLGTLELLMLVWGFAGLFSTLYLGLRLRQTHVLAL